MLTLNPLSLSGVQPNPPAENPAETLAEQGVVEADEKKKRRGRKKSKLEDMFPAYLQVRVFLVQYSPVFQLCLDTEPHHWNAWYLWIMWVLVLPIWEKQAQERASLVGNNYLWVRITKLS